MRLILATAICVSIITASCSAGGQAPLAGTVQEQLRIPAGDWVEMTPDCCWDLVTTDNQLAGFISLRNSSDTLYIRVVTGDGFPIDSLSLHADCEPPAKGNPAQFPYQQRFRGLQHEYTFAIPVDNMPAECEMFIALHADVRDGKRRRQAWGGRLVDGNPCWDFAWSRGGGGVCEKLLPIPHRPPDAIDF